MLGLVCLLVWSADAQVCRLQPVNGDSFDMVTGSHVDNGDRFSCLSRNIWDVDSQSGMVPSKQDEEAVGVWQCECRHGS